MMRNNLFVHRLRIITEEGKVAYDEKFHKGINIIRGDNSSGKSTITHFIFFVLGGAFNDFVPEARKCSHVIAEVEMNNAVITIKRELIKDENNNINKLAPLYIYWGNMEESFSPPVGTTWQKFNFSTTENKKSFSSVLFENLGLPQVKGDNNITMHQVLRLLYIDQESPTSSLFYYENFDSQITRETVSDLLLGVYNEQLYESKKRLNTAEKELDEIKSELKATRQFFVDPFDLDPERVKVKIENRELDILKIENEIIEIRNRDREVRYSSGHKQTFQILSEEAISQRRKVVDVQDEISILRAEITDSEYFLQTLEKKINALRKSIKTREFLGTIPIEYCPECLTEIQPLNDSNKCKLCKEDIDSSYGVVQARRIEQEIGFQIDESKKLLDINKRKLLELESTFSAENEKLRQIQRQVNSELKDVKSISQEKLDNLYTQKGFIEGEILQFKTLLENAELYGRLLDKKNQLDKEMEMLLAYKLKTEKEQKLLKQTINNKVKEEAIYLLNNDLVRQDEFKNANDFTIDYSNNIAFLSNKYAKYSASSNFYLKVTARFALFLASLSVESMRYPRFIFADNMEDKGIEQRRAQNLQEILIARANQFDQNQYQIIYTTSYITEELENSPYVVGEYYSKENHSLKNISKF
jgi:hypothetical protein